MQAKEAGCKVHMKPNLLGAVSGKSPGMVLLNEFPSGPETISGTLTRRIPPTVRAKMTTG